MWYQPFFFSLRMYEEHGRAPWFAFFGFRELRPFTSTASLSTMELSSILVIASFKKWNYSVGCCHWYWQLNESRVRGSIGVGREAAAMTDVLEIARANILFINNYTLSIHSKLLLNNLRRCLVVDHRLDVQLVIVKKASGRLHAVHLFVQETLY
jgi:hypothetical protein